MRIKQNDTVIVITGKDKGKRGKVLKVIPKKDAVIVEGVNIQTKHQKQTQKAAAEIKHVEGPINISNVMLVDPKTKEPTRVGYEMKNDQKVRIALRSDTIID